MNTNILHDGDLRNTVYKRQDIALILLQHSGQNERARYMQGNHYIAEPIISDYQS